MQITSSTPAYSDPTSSSAASTTSTNYLNANDIAMLEYVTGTTSLSAAEQDPYALTLANTISQGRENNTLSPDFDQPGGSSYYAPAELTASDAQMVESMTGTTNIIDAEHAGNAGVNDLISTISFERSSGQLSGNLTTDNISQMISSEQNLLATEGGLGIAVPIDTLQQALAYVNANTSQSTDATQVASPSYSATA